MKLYTQARLEPLQMLPHCATTDTQRRSELLPRVEASILQHFQQTVHATPCQQGGHHSGR